MFRIKICGVTNVEDAVAAVDAGADAIGLNFYEGSSRSISRDVARTIASWIPAKNALPIGVFVNHSLEHVNETVLATGISGVQLHGDESPGFVADVVKGFSWLEAAVAGGSVEESEAFMGSHHWLAQLMERTPKLCRPLLLRARRLDDRGVSAICADLKDCRERGGTPAAVLVDAATPGRYGGTGETVSWVGLADHRRWLGDTPLILAGGLTPDNVAEAIRIVRPAAVDVASGVESSPGKKDPIKVRDFVAAARAAFGE
jgi:phosphoribosylanthranilate isomerase